MQRSNKLFYCTFFDNRIQQSVLDKEGNRLCLLINSNDFLSLLHLGITVLISAQFHDDINSNFDDKDMSVNYARSLARENVQILLSILS